MSAVRMTKLNPKTSNYDSVGRGGKTVDNLEVAAQLAMRDTLHGHKLPEPAYWLGRLMFLHDTSNNKKLIAYINHKSLAIHPQAKRLINCALCELIYPRYVTDKKTGEKHVKPYSKAAIAQSLGKTRLSENDESYYKAAFDVIASLNSMLSTHLANT